MLRSKTCFSRRSEAVHTRDEEKFTIFSKGATTIMSSFPGDIVTVLLALAPILVLLVSLVAVVVIVFRERAHTSRQHPTPSQIQMQQLAALYQLGELQQTFDQQDHRLSFTAVALVCAPIGFALILVPWPPDAGFLLLRAWGVIWTLSCTLPAILTLTRRRAHIGVTTGGLIILKGEQRVIARWDQIEKFWRIIRFGPEGNDTYYAYKIQLTDGTVYRFTNNLAPEVQLGLPTVSRLGGRIEQEVTRVLLPPAIAACDGGADMTWDRLRLSQSQLRVDRDGGQTSLPLDDVERVTLHDEWLTIFRKGQQRAWHRQRVKTIANVEVFKGVVDHLLQQGARRQLPQIIATYQAGTPIVFGRLTLTQQGIEVDPGRKRLSWDDVRAIKITDEQVIIQSRRDILFVWKRLDRWRVPNAALLNELAAYLLQGQQMQSSVPQVHSDS